MYVNMLVNGSVTQIYSIKEVKTPATLVVCRATLLLGV